MFSVSIVLCKEILSHQGSELSSDITKEVLDVFKFKHFYSTIYNPQTNGFIERFGRTLSVLTSPYLFCELITWVTITNLDNDASICTFVNSIIN